MRKNRNLKELKLITILMLSILLFPQCKKESFVKVDKGHGLSLTAMSNAIASTGVTTSSYYLVNSLPTGFVKDGSRDYTSYVQAAVTKYNNIVFPAFPILVNDAGINIGSNKAITFLAGSEIRLKGTSKSSYNILNMNNASNVTLYNPVIKGDRYSHVGTTGEAGMGIAMRGSSNIKIYSPNVTDCWGDGIYIGQSNYNTIGCKDIYIKDAYLRKNRRDGLTIISVEGLLIDNIYAGFTDGTEPWCGINFEPDNTHGELKNIRINNPRTEKNGKFGIQIGSRRMMGNTNKTSDITIVNHVDIGSPKSAFKFYCNPIDVSGKLSGTINLINPTWIKSSTTDNPIDVSSTQPIKLNISSPEITFMSGKVLSYSEAYALIMKQASRVNLYVTNELLTTTPIVTEPVSTTSTSVVFAVNAGGSSYKAANGITYSADKNYSNGWIYKTSNAISNTSDDELYKSERYGNFSYSIPVVNGTYEITFRLSENYHKATGKRRFDILAENNEVSSNLDIFGLAGYSSAYNIVKTVTVNDGTLNLNFRTDIDQAKISAFHIIKK